MLVKASSVGGMLSKSSLLEVAWNQMQ